MKLFLDAQRDAGFAHAEAGLEILDGVPATASREEVALAKERSGYRKWLASKLDKETFGDTPLAQINIPLSFGDLHLQAMRAPLPKKNLPAPTSGPALLPPVKEADIITEKPDGPQNPADR
jgi:hypothetical protein